MKKMIFLFAMLLTAGVASATDKQYATFAESVPGNASLGLYSTEATSNNLVTCFDFQTESLEGYTKLVFKLSNKSGDGMVRVGYYSTYDADTKKYDGWTEFTNDDGNKGFGSAGVKTLNLTVEKQGEGFSMSNVKRIAFGGKNNAITINLDYMYLEDGSGNKLYANYASVGGNATFYDYTWTAGSNNLWQCFSFSAGELAKYTVIKFTLSNKKDGSGGIRFGYNNFNAFTNPDGTKGGFGSTGDKTINLLQQGIDLSTVTRIDIGGSSGTGSINIRNMYLDNEATNRTFTVGQLSTVCLPFALTAEEAAAAGTFYELSECDGTTIRFTEVEGATTAYTPYVFKAAKAEPFVALDKACVYPVGTCTATAGSATFTGVLKLGTVPSGAYGFNAASGAFSKTTTDAVTIAPFRAYITLAGAAPALLNISFIGNGTTGITTVNNANAANDGVMYNLQGQRIGEGHKGLVIKNRRKYVIK